MRIVSGQLSWGDTLGPRNFAGRGKEKGLAFPMASMARSKKSITPPMRKKPPVCLGIPPVSSSYSLSLGGAPPPVRQPGRRARREGIRTSNLRGRRRAVVSAKESTEEFTTYHLSRMRLRFLKRKTLVFLLLLCIASRGLPCPPSSAWIHKDFAQGGKRLTLGVG